MYPAPNTTALRTRSTNRFDRFRLSTWNEENFKKNKLLLGWKTNDSVVVKYVVWGGNWRPSYLAVGRRSLDQFLRYFRQHRADLDSHPARAFELIFLRPSNDRRDWNNQDEDTKIKMHFGRNNSNLPLKHAKLSVYERKKSEEKFNASGKMSFHHHLLVTYKLKIPTISSSPCIEPSLSIVCLCDKVFCNCSHYYCFHCLWP